MNAELARDARSVELVFDARRTESYDTGARRAWQTMLMPRRDQLRRVVMVTHSAALRFAAGLFALALGVPVFTRSTLPDSPADDARPIPRAAS